MYFGSVKFFKHLIYTVFCLVFIILPVTLCIVFGFKYNSLKKSAESAVQSVQTQAPVSETQTVHSEAPTEDEICSIIKAEGYSALDILSAFDENGIDYRSELYKEYFGTDGVLSYQTGYDELYTDAPEAFVYKENTVYLTFDDGPSVNTLYILDILDKYDIKATFFVTGNETQEGIEILKEIAARGHSIGIHTYSHDYDSIYTDVDAFLDDMDKCRRYIYENTGMKPDIIRMAGGSINNHNSFLYSQIIPEIMRRGYVCYDWNVSGEDARADADWTSIYTGVINGMADKKRAIILLHDSADKYNTVLTLEDIIVYLKGKGYEFDRLDNTVRPVAFDYLK